MTDLAASTVRDFLDRLAARVPAPGGGATAALHVGQAAALISMVARYSSGEKYAESADLVGRILEEAEACRARAVDLIAADAAAFTAVTDAYRLPRGTDEERDTRTAAITEASIAAARPPAEVIARATALMALAESLLPVANRSVVTDVAAATEAARAAATTARLNVEINLVGRPDSAIEVGLRRALDEVDPLIVRAASVERAVRAVVGSDAG